MTWQVPEPTPEFPPATPRLWLTLTSPDGLHKIPVTDWVEHEATDNCVCGVIPVRVDRTSGGDLWFYDHECLDPRDMA